MKISSMLWLALASLVACTVDPVDEVTDGPFIADSGIDIGAAPRDGSVDRSDQFSEPDAAFDAEAFDLGCPGCQDAAAQADGTLDAEVFDLRCPGCADAALDAEPPVDAMLDAVVDPLPFDPTPICAEITPVDLDLPGGFRLDPAPLGVLRFVGDLDGDGRDALLAQTRWDADAPIEEEARARSMTIYALEGDRLTSRGDVFGLNPFGVMLLEPLGALLIGTQLLIDIERASIDSSLAVRADRPDDPARFDTQIAFFVSENAHGELRPDYRGPFDVEVLDGDGDGRPEILTHLGHLLEWHGEGFERVWRVEDEDPRDPVAEIGGGTYGRVTHGDFDGDGRIEIVMAGGGPEGPLGTGGVRSPLLHARVFENVDDDTYRLVARLPFGANNAQFASAGDLDGDGRDEFLYGGSPGGCLRFEIWSAAADDTYVRLARIDHASGRGIPTNQGVSAFGDVDGDGDDEVVINLGEAITVWDWVDGDLRQTMGRPFCPDCNWSPVWTGDLEGDGIDEIFFSEHTGDEARRREVLSPTGVRILRRVAD